MNDLLMTSANNIGGTVALISSAALGLLAFKYNDRAIFTDRRDDIPHHIPGVPIFGALFDQVANKDRILDWFKENIDELDTMTMFASALGVPPMIMTIDPRNVNHVLKDNFPNYVKGDNLITAGKELFGHGIFVANGEQWRYQRKAASLIFNAANFRDNFSQVFVKEVNTMSEHVLDKKAASGETIDFQDIIYKFTLESFVNIGFGKNLDILTSEENVPFAVSFDYCQHVAFERVINPFTDVRDKVKSIFRPGELSHKDHIKIIDDFAFLLVKERREQLKQGHEYSDLLSRFMNARNEKGQPLNDSELRDTVLNFIIAGRDTTAQTLSWGLYYLLTHPRVEAKLVEEVKQYITDEVENDPTQFYETIKKMVYAHAVFYETLRLEPVVPSNAKMAIQDDVLPDGTHVRKGDLILWHPYSMGRAEKIWGPDAKEFKPERWVQEGKLVRESAAKWPAFHHGPRVCLGQNLATLEGLMALTLLLKRYKFTLAPNQDIDYTVSLTHPMKNGMQVYVEKRQH
ncbi:cytochrome P450 [Phascolomyces articulosus]|uniref:Cytochrome P450 n=1 Tax=Phascolomyces articulosus TaxID=60185 RepID=A0AAD5JUD5_9FUNG|nr:cytochrome P450 [Phascolomyces articulosus]